MNTPSPRPYYFNYFESSANFVGYSIVTHIFAGYSHSFVTEQTTEFVLGRILIHVPSRKEGPNISNLNRAGIFMQIVRTCARFYDLNVMAEGHWLVTLSRDGLVDLNALGILLKCS